MWGKIPQRIIQLWAIIKMTGRPRVHQVLIDPDPRKLKVNLLSGLRKDIVQCTNQLFTQFKSTKLTRSDFIPPVSGYSSPTGWHCHLNLPGPIPGPSAPTINVGRPFPNKKCWYALVPTRKRCWPIREPFSFCCLLTAMPSNQWRHCCGSALRFSSGRVRQKK